MSDIHPFCVVPDFLPIKKHPDGLAVRGPANMENLIAALALEAERVVRGVHLNAAYVAISVR